ncbi:MAG: nucleotidyltransferase family protein [Clostridia bacterium]|nr:nucleotidyltransferase family protein [Clostridia bacterium]
MKPTIEILFSLIRNAVFETVIDEETREAVFNCADKLYKFSKHHDISHLVSYAIEKNRIPLEQTELTKKLKKRHPIAAVRYEATNQIFCQVCDAFESEHIQFVPLKGSVIRDYYPEPWMRTSCDIDILVHEEDLERASMLLGNVYGYKKDESGTHDVSLFSQNGTHIELHYKLSEIYYESSAEKLIDRVWEYACPKEGKAYYCVLSDEFFYLYHIYHMAKHFESGGCGIRPFLDLWILDNKVDHDKEKRDILLNKCGLLKFADCSRELSDFWFSDGKSNETIIKLQNFVLRGGTYGTASNRHSVAYAKNDSKIKRILNTVFLSYDKLKIQYPIIRKHKWMTPFCEISRWLRIFKPGYLKIAKNELVLPVMPNFADFDNMELLLEQLGLKEKK